MARHDLVVPWSWTKLSARSLVTRLREERTYAAAWHSELPRGYATAWHSELVTSGETAENYRPRHSFEDGAPIAADWLIQQLQREREASRPDSC